jgi:multicomponent Na+:H+ antiporter subunit D
METQFADFPWAALLILLPMIAGMAAFLWPGAAKILGVVTPAAILLLVAGLGAVVVQHGPYRHSVSGWGAPLGIELYADGLSILMLGVTALVGFGVSIYSSFYFDSDKASRFWSLWLFMLAALDALFLSADIFNLYVTLELLGLSAAALTALAGTREALSGAMRYLLASLLASLGYLLGVAFLYNSFGSLDVAILSQRVQATPALNAALGLIGSGLLLKTALFPLHFWLPSAHSSAPAPVSALLSGLAVKAPFYIFLRLWIAIFGSLASGAAPLLGVLGAAAIIWGSLQAVMQTRLKLLVAYSTVAQLGYLFIAFPLAQSGAEPVWKAVVYLVFSHALAKTAIFLSAGNIMHFGGHDRIADLDRVVQRLPLSAGALGLAGISIVGLPPSGGFVGKWLLLESAIAQQQWLIVAVILLGGFLAAAYLFKVLGHAFTSAAHPQNPKAVRVGMEWAAFLLALAAIVSGFAAPLLLPVANIGSPFGGAVAP